MLLRRVPCPCTLSSVAEVEHADNYNGINAEDVTVRLGKKRVTVTSFFVAVGIVLRNCEKITKKCHKSAKILFILERKV